MDPQGRLRIPNRLRQDAGLDRECVLISVMQWIELWDPARWEATRQQAIHEYARARQQALPATKG